MKSFELMQNISNQWFTKTEYDAYVDQKSGSLNVDKLSNFVSASVWGLVLAKARASFHLTDLGDSKLMKKKYK